jgi:hypothetical protein
MVVLEEVAQSLKASAEAAARDTDYDRGRLMGYYEAMSTLLSHCAVAGIGPDALHLAADFRPEAVLGSRK